MEGLKKALANPVFFVVAYLIFMLATYVLPYGGSNSVLLQTTAAGMKAPQTGHFQMLFWLHLGSLVALCILTWLRGSHVNKSWLVIFPVVAGVFDLTPGLSLIPLVPTVMHICALVMGARGRGTSDTQQGLSAIPIQPQSLVLDLQESKASSVDSGAKPSTSHGSDLAAARHDALPVSPIELAQQNVQASMQGMGKTGSRPNLVVLGGAIAMVLAVGAGATIYHQQSQRDANLLAERLQRLAERLQRLEADQRRTSASAELLSLLSLWAFDNRSFNLSKARDLISQGADVNQHGESGSLLRCAVLSRSTDLVQSLLAVGAKPLAVETPLSEAVKKNDVNMAALLLANGAPVDQGSYQICPPLIEAVSSGAAQAVELLISKGANVNLDGGMCGFPLGTALSQNKPEIAIILRRHGATREN